MYHVISFYKFLQIPLSQLEELKRELEIHATQHGVRGLLLIGEEGCNATIAGPADGILELQRILEGRFGSLQYKVSHSKEMPFRRLRVDIRKEIVTSHVDGLTQESEDDNHLSPSEWQEWLNSERDYILLDTRNVYETELGVFEGALDLKLNRFSELAEKVTSAELPKDKTILMYCTGGIRCEKALPLMRKLGYQSIYQLRGGILDYLETYPRSKFSGECFVFDQRVAVDQDLAPSTRYVLCPHCGNPGEEPVTCKNCGADAIVCERCVKERTRQSCSKNCAHHIGRKHVNKELEKSCDESRP